MNLSIKYKILADLLAPSMIFAMFLTLYICTKFLFRRRPRIRHKKLNFAAAVLGVFLFVIGKILDTLFKMLSCRDVGGQGLVVHWYFAYEECYGFVVSMILCSTLFLLFYFKILLTFAWHRVHFRNTWIISMTSLMLIVLGFCIPYVVARKFTAKERDDPLNFIYQLSNRFRPRFWFWEYVIFVRRIMVIMSMIYFPSFYLSL